MKLEENDIRVVYIAEDFTRQRRINFFKPDKMIYNTLLENGEVLGSAPLTMQELKIIKKKCKELRLEVIMSRICPYIEKRTIQKTTHL